MVVGRGAARVEAQARHGLLARARCSDGSAPVVMGSAGLAVQLVGLRPAGRHRLAAREASRQAAHAGPEQLVRQHVVEVSRPVRAA
jgi:hypothetical protein